MTDIITVEFLLIIAMLFASFLLGMMVGTKIGKSKAYAEYLTDQKNLEATRIWANAIDKMKGGIQ